MMYSELKCKEVINCRDCKKLGRVMDLDLDDCGCVQKIYVSSRTRFLHAVTGEPEYVISFKQIRQIGPDIILVDCMV